MCQTVLCKLNTFPTIRVVAVQAVRALALRVTTHLPAEHVSPTIITTKTIRA